VSDCPFSDLSLSLLLTTCGLRELGGERTTEQIEQRVNQLKLHLSLAPSRDPEETYEQSLKYVSDSDPKQLPEASVPWEEMDEEAQGVGSEKENDKWRRVEQVTEPKKVVRKLVKGRQEAESESDDDFGEEEGTGGGGDVLSKPLHSEHGPIVSASVLLDSDDE
jgi:hypothetical protein